MTNILLFASITIVIGAGFIALDRYFVMAKDSLEKAEEALFDIEKTALKILDSDITKSTALIVVGLIGTAGCGCYVRGMLRDAIAPWARIPHRLTMTDMGKKVQQGYDDLDDSKPSVRDDFHALIALTIIYDSYKNPLSGLLFRRFLKNVTSNSSNSVTAKRKAELTAIDVITSKSKVLLPPELQGPKLVA